MGLNSLLERVKDAIFNDDDNMYHPNTERGGLIGKIEELFGQHGNGDPQYDSRPGSQNNPLPASQDPLGDPADMEPGGSGFRNVRPASEDPLGDPADQEYRRSR